MQSIVAWPIVRHGQHGFIARRGRRSSHRIEQTSLLALDRLKDELAALKPSRGRPHGDSCRASDILLSDLPWKFHPAAT